MNPAIKRELRPESLPPFARQLLWVAGGLGTALLPHVTHVSWWILSIATLSATWRIYAEVRGWRLPPKSVRVTVALLALLGVVANHRTLNGVEAGTALLVVMAGMKFLETRTARDLTVILFLAYFSLFSAFLYDQALLLLPYMLLSVWLLTATLMRIHQTTLALPLRESLRATGKMFLQALPLAALLFVLFPRLPGHFWAVPPRGQASTGLSDEVSPGDVSELSLSGAIAFRVQFEGAAPPPKERYWRGPVLHEFDGRTWRRGPARFMPQPVEPSDATYRYRLTLEPHERNWIFALDVPTEWDRRTALRTSDLQLISRRGPIAALTSFELQSSTAAQVSGPLPLVMRTADLRLPSDRNPRSLALAREMRARSANDEAFIAAVLRMFREQEYFYTLEPPRLARDSVDDFLFGTKRGFCEHFASSFAVLARAAGIPARVVTGYHGGEYNPIADYFIVRQSDAHAWTEVWLEGRGWVRVDPTAAVTPERVERGLQAAVAADEPVPDRLIRNSPTLSRLRLVWDAANALWNDQVVEFGPSQQDWLLSLLGFEGMQWEYLGVAIAVTLVVFFLALSLHLRSRFRARARDPVLQAYQQLCRKLERARLPRLPHEGPNTYFDRVGVARPDLRPLLEEARALYLDLRYGPQPLSGALSRFKHVVNQIRL